MTAHRPRIDPDHGDGTGDPAFVADATVEVHEASVWFGAKVALSELSCSFGPGVTGLLGPNGAGKTTLMRAIVGLLEVNRGRVRIEGLDPRDATGTCPRSDGAGARGRGSPGWAHRPRVARYIADLHEIADRDADARPAGGRDARRRRPSGRRVQQGHASAHEGRRRAREGPGRARPRRAAERRRSGAGTRLIELFTRLGDDGKTLIVSSHVLNEVERLSHASSSWSTAGSPPRAGTTPSATRWTIAHATSSYAPTEGDGWRRR